MADSSISRGARQRGRTRTAGGDRDFDPRNSAVAVRLPRALAVGSGFAHGADDRAAVTFMPAAMCWEPPNHTAGRRYGIQRDFRNTDSVALVLMPRCGRGASSASFNSARNVRTVDFRGRPGADPVGAGPRPAHGGTPAACGAGSVRAPHQAGLTDSGGADD
jgi:hypothetical protein